MLVFTVSDLKPNYKHGWVYLLLVSKAKTKSSTRDNDQLLLRYAVSSS